MTQTTKRCSRCHKEYEIEEFGLNRLNRHYKTCPRCRIRKKPDQELSAMPVDCAQPLTQSRIDNAIDENQLEDIVDNNINDNQVSNTINNNTDEDQAYEINTIQLEDPIDDNIDELENMTANEAPYLRDHELEDTIDISQSETESEDDVYNIQECRKEVCTSLKSSFVFAEFDFIAILLNMEKHGIDCNILKTNDHSILQKFLCFLMVYHNMKQIKLLNIQELRQGLNSFIKYNDRHFNVDCEKKAECIFHLLQAYKFRAIEYLPSMDILLTNPHMKRKMINDRACMFHELTSTLEEEDDDTTAISMIRLIFSPDNINMVCIQMPHVDIVSGMYQQVKFKGKRRCMICYQKAFKRLNNCYNCSKSYCNDCLKNIEYKHICCFCRYNLKDHILKQAVEHDIADLVKVFPVDDVMNK